MVGVRPKTVQQHTTALLVSLSLVVLVRVHSAISAGPPCRGGLRGGPRPLCNGIDKASCDLQTVARMVRLAAIRKSFPAERTCFGSQPRLHPACQPAIDEPATDQGASSQHAGGSKSSSVRIERVETAGCCAPAPNMTPGGSPFRSIHAVAIPACCAP